MNRHPRALATHSKKYAFGTYLQRDLNSIGIVITYSCASKYKAQIGAKRVRIVLLRLTRSIPLKELKLTTPLLTVRTLAIHERLGLNPPMPPSSPPLLLGILCLTTYLCTTVPGTTLVVVVMVLRLLLLPKIMSTGVTGVVLGVVVTTVVVTGVVVGVTETTSTASLRPLWRQPRVLL